MSKNASVADVPEREIRAAAKALADITCFRVDPATMVLTEKARRAVAVRVLKAAMRARREPGE